MPTQPVPIVIFGAGSIVSDAHLPAYEQNNLPVIGLYDLDYEKAKALGQKFNISVFKDPAEAASSHSTIGSSQSFRINSREFCCNFTKTNGQ